ncbi:MAG: hypothetical protein ACK4VN_10790 [Bacteroidales bacterium]
MKFTILIFALIIYTACGDNSNKKPIETETEELSEIAYQIWFNPTELDTTFYISNKFTVSLKHSQPVNIEEYFLNKSILDSLNKHFKNSYLKALEIEKLKLKLNQEFAKRDTIGLQLKLTSGEWILVEPNEEISDVAYTFEYFFKDFGFYSIRVQDIEGFGYFLLNAENETKTQIIGRPYFSPNGEFIISINFDIEAGYNYNGFQLLNNNNGNLTILFTYDPGSWGPVSAIWIDNNSLLVKNKTIEFKSRHERYVEFYSVLTIKTVGNK